MLVSGYFDSRQAVWSEPIYRNVWGLLREFGDAELATLIAPRGLIVEYSQVPAVTNQKGDLKTPKFEAVRAEFDRIDALTQPGFQPKQLISGNGGAPVGPGSPEAMEAFARLLGVNARLPLRTLKQVHGAAVRREFAGLQGLYADYLAALREAYPLPKVSDPTGN